MSVIKVIQTSSPTPTAIPPVKVIARGLIREIIRELIPTNIVWYNAAGDEGNSIVINGTLNFVDSTGATVSSDLTGKTVIAVNRENYELQPTEDLPNNKQFNWAGETPTLTFAIGNDLQEGEQIKITYI